MFVAAFFQRFIQFTQQLTLVLSQLDRCFYSDVTVQIAGETRAYALDAFWETVARLSPDRTTGDLDPAADGALRAAALAAVASWRRSNR
jgi:hypothetical protein